MATEVKMPKLSDNMEEGTIIRWLKKPGDPVQTGEPLAEVETDKADVELEASDSGVLGEIRIEEGQSAAVGETIAILTDGAKPAADTARSSAPEEAEPQARLSKSRQSSREGLRTGESEPQRAPRPAAPAGAAGVSSQRERPPSDAAVRASPLARRLAEEAAVNLAAVQGSGPGGRILKRDVEGAIGAARRGDGGTAAQGATGDSQAARAERREGSEPAAQAEGSQLRKASRTRQTIARRMAEAKREIPHFYVSAEIDMSEAVRLRQSIKQSGAMPGLTVTHLLVKALAIVLVDHPRVNASWQDDGTLFHDDINIGVAVAVEDGLVVPVLHRAQRLSLQETSQQVKALTDKARRGKFGGGDLSGGTFSVSNVGMLDVDELVAVINPPQAAILAVGAVKTRPIVREGQLGVAPTMRATLSCDHRVLNGVEGGEFLADVKRVLENPVMLLVS